MRHHIVFLDRSMLDADVRRPGFMHSWREYPLSAPEDVPHRLAEATIAITSRVPLRAEVLEHLPSLELIAIAANGCDVVDLAYCSRNGISVSHIGRDAAAHRAGDIMQSLADQLINNIEGFALGMPQHLVTQCEDYMTNE